MTSLGEAEAHAAALAGLSGMTPVRLSKLLDNLPPTQAWHALRAGSHPADPCRRFVAPARATDVEEIGGRYATAGIKILLPGAHGYPAVLVADPGAPAVLFALGDPTVLEDRPRVAIVGTRSATHYGRQVASEMAAELAEHDVVVVSGLAVGIDGAAHAGVMRLAPDDAAPPVAVVGTGLDVVYPNANGELWGQVARRGVVLSESALGTKPHPGVFPARNRIIAALANVVVVVESHHGGGSLYTAEAAARRSIPVCAVPGSVRSRTSAGTNGLLVDGCIPVRDATDVLVAISLARSDKGAGATGGSGSPGTANVTRPADRPAHVTRPADRPVIVTRPADRPANVTRPADRSANEVGRGGTAAKVARGAGADMSRRHMPDVADGQWTSAQRSVWEAVDDAPTTFESILIRTNMSIAEAAKVCDQLVGSGALLSGAGWWSRQWASSSLNVAGVAIESEVTETSDTETPDTETSDTETPDTETPDTETPDTETCMGQRIRGRSDWREGVG